MDQPFYITLTSDSGDFKCTLPTPIELKCKYDVAVLEYVYDVKWQNMEEVELTVVSADGTTRSAIVPKGFYVSIDSWISAWRDALPVGFKQYVTKGVFHSSIGWYDISVGEKDAKANGHVRVSDYAKRVLQLSSNEIRSKTSGHADMNLEKRFFIMHGNFVEPQLLNNTMLPYLYMTRLNFIRFEMFSILHKQPVTPKFVPVNTQRLQNLLIETKFETGAKPVFQNAVNQVVLFFRPKC